MTVALVIGATGLVGSALVRQLLADPCFAQIVVLARRPVGIQDSRLEAHIVDFERLDTAEAAIRGDVLFSAMGTTRAQVGSKEAQYRVDYTYQYEVARCAAAKGVPAYVLISSAGASAASPFFYMRMKGELERDVARLPFRSIHILQPGYLDGAREKPRAGEGIGLAALKAVNRAGLFRQYRPIHARTVAAAMIAASFDETPGATIHPPGALFALGGEGAG